MMGLPCTSGPMNVANRMRAQLVRQPTSICSLSPQHPLNMTHFVRGSISEAKHRHVAKAHALGVHSLATGLWPTIELQILQPLASHGST